MGHKQPLRCAPPLTDPVQRDFPSAGGSTGDLKSGKNDARPELKACHAFLERGDTLVVPSLDRYGRSLQDLVNMVAELRTRGCCGGRRKVVPGR